MGINNSKSIENLTFKIHQELSHIGTTSQCKVGTGNITLKNSNRCAISRENKCALDGNMAIDAVAKGIMKAWLEASPEQKILLLPDVNINETQLNVTNKIKYLINQKCGISRTVTEDIVNRDLIINDCDHATIFNTNTGSIGANCGIRSAIDTINKTDKPQPKTKTLDIMIQIIKENSMISFGLFSGCFAVLCIFLIMAIIALTNLI